MGDILNNRVLHDIEFTNGNIYNAKKNRTELNKLYMIDSLEDAKLYLSLLKDFRSFVYETEDLHGEKFHEQIKKMLSVGEDGIYNDNLRFIFELIQNVDDCDYDENSDKKLNINFNIQNDTIVLTYLEKGFNTKNVFSLTGLWDSSKNVDDFQKDLSIGEKGIGFKSIFGIAEKVLVESGYFSFYLDSERMIIPEPEYTEYTGFKGTRLTLYLENGKAYEIYKDISERYSKWTTILNLIRFCF